jgi:hypothetical protein
MVQAAVPWLVFGVLAQTTFIFEKVLCPASSTWICFSSVVMWILYSFVL